ncbi:MAG: SPFH domain-containing protein [Ignavibacteriaceae bacterium]|jgi:regulator of protease activity HflC (stomatin/prohibitin superfamily)|nr:SPFH domain-containing protein [Ignavibacteriaceae bacterium]
MEAITEKNAFRINGFIVALFVFLLALIEVFLIIQNAGSENPNFLFIFFPIMLVIVLIMPGFLVVQPNESKVLILFGKYIGTIRNSGFWWANPFTIKKHISLRIRNFNSDKIKVNDIHGNPIEIAAVIVWKVVDCARALFDVESFEKFVEIQSETAIRALATEYPYDSNDNEKESLRGNTKEISENLQQQLQTRLEIAGVKVVESRLSHLAYAQEIAQAMLRRQQAQAVVAARQKIVEGAVGMVQMALSSLSEQNIVNLDEEKKAAMVNNLLVALVSETQASPVINTGTLY